MRGWAALMHALGMSLRSAGDTLSAFGESLSHTSVWRDVQEAGENAPERASAVGADETHARMNGKKKVVGVVTDARTGQVLGLDVLVERDSDAFMDWIGRRADEFGVESIAADDLNTYKPVVERC